MAYRSVERVIVSRMTYEGDGFLVQRPFPGPGLREVDPFLLLDEMGPNHYGPGQARGASDHPHRGFETVTYLLAGALRHRDSFGHTGVLRPGDVQWMTAGSGLIHAELPEENFLQTGGELHGVQLWVNLPARSKNLAPHYQEYPGSSLPLVQTKNALIRLIAGQAFGAVSPIRTHTPILYYHARLLASGTLEAPVGEKMNVLVYVLDGRGFFGRNATPGRDAEALLFRQDGDMLMFAADPESELNVLVAAGDPIGETVARYGPFVMNTEAEIRQTIEDFQAGAFRPQA